MNRIDLHLTTRRLVRLGALWATLATLPLGCATPPDTGGTAPAPSSDALPEGPTSTAIVSAQTARLAKLLPLHASGQVELRWVDEDGSHFEFCRGDLFAAAGPLVALDLRKAGERFLFLGCDAQRSWAFDLRAAPRRLDVWPHGTAAQREQAAGVSALDLVDLTGLGPFRIADGEPEYEPASGQWTVKAEGLGGPIRVWVERNWLVPVRIDALDEVGNTRLSSTLEEYRGIDRPGLPPGALPRLPERVRIVAPQRDTSVMLSLATADPDGSAVAPGLFDLERLVRILRPEDVQGLEPR
ncbi:MAG: hypothetical protein KDA22_01785 [Phycisphaerales bacterium]|nr:hypothetical protein [Phycisphaerales bacterium]